MIRPASFGRRARAHEPAPGLHITHRAPRSTWEGRVNRALACLAAVASMAWAYQAII